MTKEILKPLFWFVVCFGILGLMHAALLNYVFPASFADPRIFKAYILFSVYALILMLYLMYLRRTDPVKAGWAYLAGGMFKMFLAIFFLMPTINARANNMKIVVLQIVVVYFIGLMIEVFILFKALKTPDKA